MEEELKQGIDNEGKKRAFKNIIIVAISNIISLAAGILAGFLLPKIFDKIEYSNYKTFALYASYLGVLHFGICDGIYLKYAGMKYEDLDRGKFGCFTRVFFIIETILSAIVVLVSLVFLSGFYKFIFMFLGINILAVNVTTYYELISQTTERFKLVSLRNVVRATMTVLSIGILVILYYTNGFSPSYILYISIVVGINLLLALWYLLTYRKITFGKFDKIKTHKTELISLYKVGFILLFSNFITQIIFIVDQQFVNILFDKIDFANYAFAYSLVQLILVAINAISTVLYPTLNKTDDENVKNNYGTINAYLLLFMAFAIFAYYPLYWFINAFLPNYTDSLPIFRAILPGILISASVTVIKANVFKKLKHINVFMFMAIGILLFSIIINIIAYLIFKSMLAISIATVITNSVWYVITELFLIKKYKIKWLKNCIYMILVISSYYLVYLIPNDYIGGLVYIIFLIFVSIIMYKKELIDALNIFRKRKKKEKEIVQ